LFTFSSRSKLSARDLGFLIFLAASVAVFWKPLKHLFTFSLTQDYATHIILIVPVSAGLIYLKRGDVFFIVRTAPLPGSVLFFTGTILWYFAARCASWPFLDLELSLITLVIVLVWISGFILFFGMHAFAMARFPLLFLLLLVPIPQIALEKIIYFLQAGSAAVAYGLLRLLSVPVFKQGFILRLPTLDVEVAKQCSGVRSSLALLITVLIAGDFVLRSAWRKTLLALAIVPILILKNGVRIVTVSLLSIYVSRRFLHGWLHTSGGIVFYLLGLALLIPVAIILRRSEKRVKAVSGFNFSPAGTAAASSSPATSESSATRVK
jgi:exosortase